MAGEAVRLVGAAGDSVVRSGDRARSATLLVQQGLEVPSRASSPPLSLLLRGHPSKINWCFKMKFELLPRSREGLCF